MRRRDFLASMSADRSDTEIGSKPSLLASSVLRVPVVESGFGKISARISCSIWNLIESEFVKTLCFRTSGNRGYEIKLPLTSAIWKVRCGASLSFYIS